MTCAELLDALEGLSPSPGVPGYRVPAPFRCCAVSNADFSALTKELGCDDDWSKGGPMLRVHAWWGPVVVYPAARLRPGEIDRGATR